jgi:hypothetical protein
MGCEMTRPPDQPVPKPFRPRDEYGRPLRPDEADRLALPNFDAMNLEEAHEAALRFFDAGNYFAAHEAWETCWGLAKGTDEEEFFKGLAQLGAGYTHWMRGNAHGVVALRGPEPARPQAASRVPFALARPSDPSGTRRRRSGRIEAHGASRLSVACSSQSSEPWACGAASPLDST